MKNFLLRSLSAIILSPLVLLVIYLGSWPYNLVIVLIALIASLEWNSITHRATRKRAWQLTGVLYIALPCLSLLWLRSLKMQWLDGQMIDFGVVVVLWLVLIVWMVDISAFVFGRIIGGPKLAPSISPNKTWAGFLGALLVVFGVHYALTQQLGSSLAIAATAIVPQLGDLFESWVKRQFGVKDSGRLIPGHGGILDRIDGLLFYAVFVAIVMFVAMNSL